MFCNLHYSDSNPVLQHEANLFLIEAQTFSRPPETKPPVDITPQGRGSNTWLLFLIVGLRSLQIAAVLWLNLVLSLPKMTWSYVSALAKRLKWWNVVWLFPKGRKKPVSATPKEMEWAQMACHRCLVYLGDLGNKVLMECVIVSSLYPACRFVRQHVCVIQRGKIWLSYWVHLAVSCSRWLRYLGWFSIKNRNDHAKEIMSAALPVCLLID